MSILSLRQRKDQIEKFYGLVAFCIFRDKQTGFNFNAQLHVYIIIVCIYFAGISTLDALTELDVSGNCILDHSSLLPLSSLITLSFLNLHGNPLSFHPTHRQITAQCLHKNTASVKVK